MTSASSSAVSPWTGALGLAGLTIGLAFAWLFRLSPESGVLCVMIACAVPMVWHERYRAARLARREPPAQQPASVRLYRLIGILVLALPWAATLTGFHHFADGGAAGFFAVTIPIAPALLALGAVYLFRQPRGGDTAERLGTLLLTGCGGSPEWWALWRVQWLKALFLPLMVSFAYDWMSRVDRDVAAFNGTALSWYLLPLALMYLVDVVFGTIGYVVSSRSTGTEIRSTDSTWGGWLVALICYPPFFGWLALLGLNRYRDGFEWHHWLGDVGVMTYAWGGAILLLTGVYAWATVIFGLRFSNLTHRGIITNGPFRYTKHPAYIAKNLSWWMVSIPFISNEGTLVAVGHCAALLLVNVIYFLRAKTEERHLSADPAYREYVQWIAEHGVFANLQRYGIARIRFGRA